MTGCVLSIAVDAAESMLAWVGLWHVGYWQPNRPALLRMGQARSAGESLTSKCDPYCNKPWLGALVKVTHAVSHFRPKPLLADVYAICGLADRRRYTV